WIPHLPDVLAAEVRVWLGEDRAVQRGLQPGGGPRVCCDAYRVLRLEQILDQRPRGVRMRRVDGDAQTGAAEVATWLLGVRRDGDTPLAFELRGAVPHDAHVVWAVLEHPDGAGVQSGKPIALALPPVDAAAVVEEALVILQRLNALRAVE